MNGSEDNEVLAVGNAYVDAIELAQKLETERGVARPLVIEALLAAAMSLCGSREVFVAAVDDIKLRYRVGEPSTSIELP